MKHFTLFIFFVILTFGCVQATEIKLPTLREVMVKLADSTGALNQGIFYEDFELIEKAALEIADHPKPKEQLPIVVETLGPRMLIFKQFDNKVHNAARDIAVQAKQKDMEGILENHTVMMRNCVACHSQFKKEISTLFP